MTYPSLIKDMPFRRYLDDPCEQPSVTSSIVRAMIDSAPAKVRLGVPRLNRDFQETHATRFDIGTAAHALLVGGGNALEILDYDSYRTDDAKDDRDTAYANDRTPLLAKNYDRVVDMVDAGRPQFLQNPIMAEVLPDPKLLSEATVVWRERGVTCRCRPDWFAPQFAAVVHYKTVGVSLVPDQLARYASSMGWDLIAAHYGAGIKLLTGVEPHQVFAVQSVKPPYLATVVELDLPFVETATAVRETVLATWGRCLATGRWPGHTARTVTLECPAWHESRGMEAARRFRERRDPLAGTIELQEAD